MKSIILSLSTLFITGITVTAPVAAVTYIPSVVAPLYCALRSRGYDHNTSLSAAADQGVVAGDHWYYTTYGGVRMQSDIAETSDLIMRICPQYIR